MNDIKWKWYNIATWANPFQNIPTPPSLRLDESELYFSTKEIFVKTFIVIALIDIIYVIIVSLLCFKINETILNYLKLERS